VKREDSVLLFWDSHICREMKQNKKELRKREKEEDK
jgi:hypothetical protein